MDKKKFGELWKKCFGKQKEEKYHAVAMLVVYVIFFTLVVLFVRFGVAANSDNSLESDDSITPTPTPTEPTGSTSSDDFISGDSDINYSYSYSVVYNGNTGIFLGKKLDDKEKITYIKNGVTTEYAIFNDNFLVLDNGSYRITSRPSDWFFEYCDIEAILLAIKDEISITNQNITTYNVSNKVLSNQYDRTLAIDNEKDNTIILTIENDNLKSAEVDFSNFISSIRGDDSTLTIKMEFVDIGTTSDFEIPFGN